MILPFLFNIFISKNLFLLLLPGLPAANHRALQTLTPTYQADDRNPFMHLQCGSLEEAKHALETSQPDTRSPHGDLPFCLFGLQKNSVAVSIQVQTVKREARAVMGSVLIMFHFHFNNKHQLAIRWRQMKANSSQARCCVFLRPEGWVYIISPSVTLASAVTPASVLFTLFGCPRKGSEWLSRGGRPAETMNAACSGKSCIFSHKSVTKTIHLPSRAKTRRGYPFSVRQECVRWHPESTFREIIGNTDFFE